MKSKSITHRWVINSLGVILFILVGLEIVFGFGVKTYFYDFAKRSLENKATMPLTAIPVITEMQSTS